jgi:hypothetical protein
MINDALDKPVRERCEAALDIAKEALRHIERIAPNPRIKEFANHALNKVGVIMAAKSPPDADPHGEPYRNAIPVYRLKEGRGT